MHKISVTGKKSAEGTEALSVNYTNNPASANFVYSDFRKVPAKTFFSQTYNAADEYLSVLLTVKSATAYLSKQANCDATMAARAMQIYEERKQLHFSFAAGRKS